MHDTLHTWEMLGIAFKSQREQFDTGTPIGRLMLNMLAALAEFELELIRERVKAGMERARRQGKRIGRPSVIEKRVFKTRFKAVMNRIESGELSRRKAARELDIGYATQKRLIDTNWESLDNEINSKESLHSLPLSLVTKEELVKAYP